MKKGLCIVLSALLVAASFSACAKKIEGTTEIETQINTNGESIVTVTDKNGDAVTDASGNVQTSVLSDKDKEEIEKKKDKTKDKTKTTTSKKNNSGKDKTSSTVGVNPEISDVLEGDSFLDITAAQEDLFDEGTATAKTTLFQDKVQKVMKTGKFTVDMNVTSGGQKAPMKLAFDGDKMYASFSSGGIKMSLIYMDKTAYIVMPNLLTVKNVYFKYPDTNGDFSEIFDSFDKVSESNGKYVGSTKVKVKTTTYTCEEYKSDDGTIYKYYFDKNNNWKRYECIGKDEMMVYEINSFTGTVDQNLFSLKGYTELDPKLLEGVMG